MYKVKQEVIPRDIAGLYFLVDIAEKEYYSKKKIFSVNQTGYEQFKIMKELKCFTLEELVAHFVKLLADYTDDIYNDIVSDTEVFIGELISAGYLEETRN